MTGPASPPHPAWAGAWAAQVDEAFSVTGADTPGWPDPHPDRRPLEEEYSRVTDQEKYGILQTRVEAWAEVLAASQVAVTRDVPPEPWAGSSRSPADHQRVRRLDPVHPGGLSLLLATTVVDGRPFGLDVGVVGASGRPVFLDPLPDCGCDACDSGSADLLEVLDHWVLTVARGGVVHACRGDDAATRTWHGYRTTNRGQEAWLDESSTVPEDVERWIGSAWV